MAKKRKQEEGGSAAATGPAPAAKAAQGRKQQDEPTAGNDGYVPHGLDTDPLAFLVAPEAVSEFTSSVWEKQPRVFKATPDRRRFFKDLFHFETLKALAAQRVGDEDSEEPPLEFGVDVNAARYVDGVRETPNDDGPVLAPVLQQKWEEGCTFQVHQPQRFDDKLWRLLAALEAKVGCLVGSNAYLTPAGTQGLAPHYDDVEIFVCQMQGAKKWRVYGSLDGQALPFRPSGDLPEDVLPQPLLEVELQVGDVLYMPRGTVHQAVAGPAGASSHLTLSTYQQWTWANLASQAIMAGLAMPPPPPPGEAQAQQEGEGKQAKGKKGAAAARCFGLPLALRKGLPWGFLTSCGLQGEIQRGPRAEPGTGALADAARQLAAGLRALADTLEAHPEEVLPTAVDAMAEDFIKHRLPPHPEQLRDQGPAPPGLADSIVARGSGLFSLVPAPELQEEGDEEEAPEGWIRLTTPLENDREHHMMHGGGSAGGHHHHDHSDDEDEDDEDGDDEAVLAALNGDGDGDNDARDSLQKALAALRREDHHRHHGGKHKHSEACGAGCAAGGKGKGKAKGGKGKAKEEEEKEEEEEEEEAGAGDGESDEDAEGISGSGDDSDEGIEESDDGDDGGDGLPGLVFPAKFAVLLSRLFAPGAPPMRVSELPLPAAVLQKLAQGAEVGSDSDDDGADGVEGPDKVRLRLAYTLWAAGYVATVPAAAEGAKAAGGPKAAKGDKAKAPREADGEAAGKKAAKKAKTK